MGLRAQNRGQSLLFSINKNVQAWGLILLFISIASLSLTAQETTSEKAESKESFKYFESYIRPALVKYCYECHSEESGKNKGGLLLDTKEGLRLGGDSGPALNNQNLEESLIWSAISWGDAELKMPPKVQLPEDIRSKFKLWLKMGAPDPRSREQVIVSSKIDLEKGKKHWAFQPVKAPNKGANIDFFIDTALAQNNLRALGPADPYTLLRRLYYDLIGLPPSPQEIESFMAKWKVAPEKTWALKVDELLLKPQYGEQWGRHWLDVARYAESSGQPNFTFPNAWRYRDYIIDAFNTDTPYNQMVKEQVCGDLIPYNTPEERQKNLIATGFLALGTKRLDEQNPRKFQMDMIDEQIDAMSQSILGLTVSCARCHDHKFDPIPTSDYYALAGIFLSSDTKYGTVMGQQNHRPSTLIPLPIADRTSPQKSLSAEEVNDMQAQKLEAQANIKMARVSAKKEGKKPERKTVVKFKNKIDQINGELSTMNSEGVPLTLGMGVLEAEKVINAHVLLRGDPEKPAQEVQRGFLQVINIPNITLNTTQESGRRELGEWLSSDNNPLTARVMVNRIWMHLLGQGIVSSPNNWGLEGQRPSHPELLDYLAYRFVQNQWSIKTLIREIVLSKAYQRSSGAEDRVLQVDADNRYLWRMNPRPMCAESIRDTMLKNGSYLKLERPLASAIAEISNSRIGRGEEQCISAQAFNYRSVYLPIIRDMVPDSLAAFDFSDPNFSTPQRNQTNVPSQALYLLNNDFVQKQATGMALLLSALETDPQKQVEQAFLWAYQRPVTADELEASLMFLNKIKSEFIRQMPSALSANHKNIKEDSPYKTDRKGPEFPLQKKYQKTAKPTALMLLCQSLMASAEYRILN